MHRPGVKSTSLWKFSYDAQWPEDLEAEVVKEHMVDGQCAIAHRGNYMGLTGKRQYVPWTFHTQGVGWRGC